MFSIRAVNILIEAQLDYDWIDFWFIFNVTFLLKFVVFFVFFPFCLLLSGLHLRCFVHQIRLPQDIEYLVNELFEHLRPNMTRFVALISNVVF